MHNRQKLLDLQYVRTSWDDTLKGKRVFVGDTIGAAIDRFCADSGTVVVESFHDNANDYPFLSEEGLAWQVAYYDPYLELKVAESEGKVIQRWYAGEWHDLNTDSAIVYNSEPHMYRVKPEGGNLVSNRQLAKWLAQGLGECRTEFTNNICTTNFVYSADEYAGEWHDPTREYLGIEK